MGVYSRTDNVYLGLARGNKGGNPQAALGVFPPPETVDSVIRFDFITALETESRTHSRTADGYFFE